MKITILVQQLDKYGGTEMVSTEVANMLIHHYDVQIIALVGTTNIYNIDNRIKIKYLNYNKNIIHSGLFIERHAVKIFAYIYLFFAYSFFLFFDRFRLRRKIYNLTADTDLIIASSGDNYITAPKKRKVYFHYHFNFNYFKSRLEATIRKLSRKPDGYIVLSKLLEKDVSQYFKNKMPCFAIYNSVRFPNNLMKGYNGNRFIFVGRLENQKQPLHIPHLAQKLKERGLRFSIDMFGEGTLKKQLLNSIKENEVSDFVTVHDFSSNIDQELMKSDLLLVTSAYEGFMLAIGEANIFGTPAVILDWGPQAKEQVSNGINGYICRSIDEMADRIVRICADKEKLLALRVSSNHHAKQYLKENIEKEWIRVIENLR